MGRISPGPTRWPPGAERRLVPAKSNLKPQRTVQFPLCILFLCLNSLCILRMNLLWCLFLLHFRYTKVSMENKGQDSKTSRNGINKTNKELDGAAQ